MAPAVNRRGEILYVGSIPTLGAIYNSREQFRLSKHGVCDRLLIDIELGSIPRGGAKLVTHRVRLLAAKIAVTVDVL